MHSCGSKPSLAKKVEPGTLTFKGTGLGSTKRKRSPLLAELIRAHSRRAEPDEVLDEISVAKDSRPADADQDRLDCHDGGNCNAQQRSTACQ